MRLLPPGLVLVLGTAFLHAQPAWHNGMVRVTSKSKAAGSGFVVAVRDGTAYIVTCAHVAGDETQVSFNVDLDKVYSATVRDAEAESDERALAILRVANPPNNIAVIPPAAQAITIPGTRVEVGGFPAAEGGVFFPLDPVATSKGRDLMLSVPVQPGYSGGPVIWNGAVVGLVYARTGFGRALGAASVRAFLEGSKIEWGGSESGLGAVPAPRPPERQPGETRNNPKDGLTYVWIPPGKFVMGCSEGDKECDKDDEFPPHEVEITKGFWMGQTEVTQRAYERVKGTNPSRFNGADLPVETVTWAEAGGYCNSVGLRLPTEAEWEYAARAGSTNARYGPLDEIAWYSANSGKQPHPVAKKTPNQWGLYDMLGNVWEWVIDWYDPKYYAKRVRQDPAGPASSPKNSRGVRGASWLNLPEVARVSYRGGVVPTLRLSNLGFRCAGELR